MATALYGSGTALSVDKAPTFASSGWRVQIWNPRGVEVLCSWSQGTKAEALGEMRVLLEAQRAKRGAA